MRKWFRRKTALYRITDRTCEPWLSWYDMGDGRMYAMNGGGVRERWPVGEPIFLAEYRDSIFDSWWTTLGHFGHRFEALHAIAMHRLERKPKPAPETEYLR